MLVHMTPGEVAGLQALAMKHGGSLTINPETGLAEAGFLKKLLPAVIGFGLNMFAPGLGSAVGAALGTSAAVGTGVAVGGFEALRTGSLSKGLQAGLGAYGGAGLASSMANAGASQLIGSGAPIGVENVAGSAVPPIEQINPSNFSLSNADKLGAGFKAVTDSPSAFGQFAKQNAGSLLAATSPMMADQGVETVTKMNGPAYIQNFDYDPMTQRAKALNPVSLKSLGYPGYADGGLMHLHRKFAEGGAADNRYGSSEAAYNYLMGLTDTTRPDVAPLPIEQSTFYIPPATTTPATGGDSGGGGGGASSFMGTASVGNTPSVGIDPYDQAGQNAVSKLEREIIGTDDELGYLTGNRPEPMFEPEPPPFEPDNSGFYNSEFNTSRDIDDASISEGVRNSDFVPANPSDFGESTPASTPFEPYDIGPVPAPADDDELGYLTDNRPEPMLVQPEPAPSPAPVYDYIEPPAPAPASEPYDYGSAYVPANPSDFGAIDDGGGYDGFIGDEDNIDEDSYDYQGMATGGMVPGYADGGVSGSGSLDLHVPINIGGGGGGAGGFGGGYTPVGGGNGMTSTPNVNPNANGGFGGGLAAMFGGGGRPQNGFGGMPQGLAGLFGNSGFAPQGFMGQMQQMDDMDMYSHAPNPFMEVPAVQNYQDVIRGRSNMLSGMGGTAQNGYMSPGGMGGYNPFTGRPSENNIAASFHSIQSTPSFGGTFAQGGSVGSYLPLKMGVN